MQKRTHSVVLWVREITSIHIKQYSAENYMIYSFHILVVSKYIVALLLYVHLPICEYFFHQESKKHNFLEKYLYTDKPPLTATSPQRPRFLADSPYIDSCLNLSTMASFFCPQVGRCGEVQLYVCGSCRITKRLARCTKGRKRLWFTCSLDIWVTEFQIMYLIDCKLCWQINHLTGHSS